MSHRNAPLTTQGRLLLCRRIAGGRPIAHVAAAIGISRQCASKWWHRYLELGADGLHDRSSRPRCSPTRTTTRLEERICRRRRADKVGPDRLAIRLELEIRTPNGLFAVEMTPVPNRRSWERGAVAEGAVGTRWAGRLRFFR